MCWFKLGAKGRNVSFILNCSDYCLHQIWSHLSKLILWKWYLFKLTIPFCHHLILLTVGVDLGSETLPHSHLSCVGPMRTLACAKRPGWARPACWNPWWAPCLCLRMWKKPGTGPRSASQNYITIIPLSVSEASWAPAQSGRKVGEGWQWVGLYWITESGSYPAFYMCIFFAYVI